MRAYASAVSTSLSEVIKEAAAAEHTTVNHDLFNEEQTRASQNLFYMLAMLLKGKALAILQSTPDGVGAEAWRRLCQEYEPKAPGRFQGMLVGLLHPTRGDDAMRTIVDWTKAVELYEKQSGDKLPDTIKTSVMMTNLVEPRLAEHHRLKAARLDTFERTLTEVSNYLLACRKWGDDPMQTDALTKGKKGKGKGKKGKGKQQELASLQSKTKMRASIAVRYQTRHTRRETAGSTWQT